MNNVNIQIDRILIAYVDIEIWPKLFQPTIKRLVKLTDAYLIPEGNGKGRGTSHIL
jgi:hypothetical protein